MLSGNSFNRGPLYFAEKSSVMYRCEFVPSDKSMLELKALIQVAIKCTCFSSKRHTVTSIQTPTH